MGSILIRPSPGLAPEIEQLRTQDIYPDEDSAAFRALKAASSPSKSSPDDHASSSNIEPNANDMGPAKDNNISTTYRRVSFRGNHKNKKNSEKRVEGRIIQQVN